MNDRELLELAAKAAGYELRYLDDGSILVNARRWHPLADDGDAMRLAVKLRIDIQNLDTGVCAQRNYGSVRTYAVEPYTHDPAAATRRAIVCAAAQTEATQPSKDGGGDEQGRLGSAVDYWRKNALKVDGTIRTSDARATDNKEQ